LKLILIQKWWSHTHTRCILFHITFSIFKNKRLFSFCWGEIYFLTCCFFISKLAQLKKLCFLEKGKHYFLNWQKIILINQQFFKILFVFWGRSPTAVMLNLINHTSSCFILVIAHHYENFLKIYFTFILSIRYSICVCTIFLYNINCLPSSLLPPVEKIATLLTVLLTLLNDFLKTNTGSRIQINFILFLVTSSFISHCFNKL